MAGSVRKKISPSGSSPVSGNGPRVNQRRTTLTLSQANPLVWEAREVMDIRQASDYLGISSDSLYKYASESLIPAFKLGNRWRFKRSRLDEWMDRQSELRAGGEVDAGKKKPVQREAAGSL